jgi:hypothetical protein
MRLAIILLMCGAAWGQQADKHPARKDPRNFVDAPPITQEPVEKLTCLEYQHVDHWLGRCGPQQCDATSCFAVCSPVPPDKCVDDIHTVTEREFQEILARLKALESKK